VKELYGTAFSCGKPGCGGDLYVMDENNGRRGLNSRVGIPSLILDYDVHHATTVDAIRHAADGGSQAPPLAADKPLTRLETDSPRSTSRTGPTEPNFVRWLSLPSNASM
jgi:hypothetical protein